MFNPVIMLTLNNLALTKKAVVSVLAQDIEGGVDLLVMDNGSTDGTVEWIHSQMQFMVSFGDRDRSVAKSWNQGLDFWFRKMGADHCLIVNNDIRLHPANYRLLLSHGGDFVTGVSVDNEDALLIAPMPSGDRPHPDFSNMMLRRAAFDKTGPFDERYSPAYFEDNDYHVRAYRAGVNAVCIDVPFYHYASGAIKAASAADRKRIQMGADKNKRLFFQTYGCYPATHEYEMLFA